MISYQRPREKAEQAGISSLSVSELLQLIIGSGTGSVPVSKIARGIEQLLVQSLHSPQHRDLIQLGGVGPASAWRVLAALELGKIFIAMKASFYQFDTAKFKKSKKAILGYAMFDSSGCFIEEAACRMGGVGSTSFTVRALCADVLAKSGFSLQLLLYEPITRSTPTQTVHSFVSELAALSSRLQLEVTRITWVSKNTMLILKGSQL